MKKISKAHPMVSILYQLPRATVQDWAYTFELPDGRHYSLDEIKRNLSLTARQAALLKAEALDLVLPLGNSSQLSSLTVVHDRGQYSTSFNAGAGRYGMAEYFCDNILYLNLGLPGEDEDGTPCRVLKLIFVDGCEL